ncbi:hypothetical protein ACLOJK_023446 [Asimina triloba]
MEGFDVDQLLAPELRETLQDHQAGRICLNEFMFKVGVRVPFKFSVTELLYVFGTAPIHLTPNSWKIIQIVVYNTNRYFWRFLLSRKVIQGLVTFTGKHTNMVVNNLPHSMKRGRGVVLILEVPDWWRERLPDVEETASFSSKEIFFRWCQGLTFFGALVAFVRGEADVRRSGEASSSLAGAGSLAEGLAVLVREEGRLRKKRRLKKAIHEGQGPVMLQEEEEERLARREDITPRIFL